MKATPRAYINYQHLNELMRTIVPNFGTKSGMWNYGGGDHFETNRQYILPPTRTIKNPLSIR